MDSATLPLVKFLTEIGGSDFLSDFESNFGTRLKTHKIVYMLQEMGSKPYGGRFSWYLNGPYSPALTELVFSDVLPSLAAITPKTAKVRLTEKGCNLVRKVRTFFGGQPAGLGLVDHEWYELLASAHYLSRTYDVVGEGLANVLHQQRPLFTDAQVRAAVNAYELKRPFLNL